MKIGNKDVKKRWLVLGGVGLWALLNGMSQADPFGLLVLVALAAGIGWLLLKISDWKKGVGQS